MEERGFTIVANIGDQASDLANGHAERAFKLPNPIRTAVVRALRRSNQPCEPTILFPENTNVFALTSVSFVPFFFARTRVECPDTDCWERFESAETCASAHRFPEPLVAVWTRVPPNRALASAEPIPEASGSAAS
jgi:hypothetical protein